MKKSKNYNLPLPEGSDEMLIEQVSEGIGKLDEELGKTDKKISDHLADTNNPHGLTKKTVTDLLGYIPANTDIVTNAKNGLMSSSDKNRLENVISLCNELNAEVARLKNSIGNAYLKDAVESITVEVIRQQYSGHSEYTFYDIRCIGCKTTSGSNVSNSGDYIRYGDRNYSCGDVYISVNPKALIVTPVTGATLDNILYIGSSIPSGYVGFTILDYNDTHSWDIGEEDGYAVYDILHQTITL